MKRLTRTQSALSLIILATVLGAVAIPVSDLIYDPRGKLTEEHEGINHQYYQHREPTEGERQAGERAFHSWKTAPGFLKSKLASELILGKTLVGLTQKEIVDEMGTPDGFGCINDVDPEVRHTGYNCLGRLFDESVCDLLIDLDDSGKTCRAYLDVNY